MATQAARRIGSVGRVALWALEHAVTNLSKLLLSLALIAAGFGVASLVGPPEQPGGLAYAPADAGLPWGELRPPASPVEPKEWLAPLDEIEWAATSAPPSHAPQPLAPQPAGQTDPNLWPTPPSPQWAARPHGGANVQPASGSMGGELFPVVPASPATQPSLPLGGGGAGAPAGAPPAAPPGAAPWPAPPAEDRSVSAPPALLMRVAGPGTPPGGAEPGAQDEGPGWGAEGPASPLPALAPPGAPAMPASLSRGPVPRELPRLEGLDLRPIGEAAQAVAPQRRTHLVADGDTLDRLSARYLGDPARAGEIFAQNRDKLPRADLLPLGVELEIPSGPPAPAPVAGQ